MWKDVPKHPSSSTRAPSGSPRAWGFTQPGFSLHNCAGATCHLRDIQQPGVKGVGWGHQKKNKLKKKKLKTEGNKQALEDLRVIWF